MSKDQQFPEAELARLADGSLPPEREDELRAQIKASPALARALAEQERAVALVRSTAEVSAPDALRARLQELTADSTKSPKRERARPRWRWSFGLPALAGAVAAAAVAAVLLIGNGTSGPSLHQTAQAALAPATLPPPTTDPQNPRLLGVKVAGISFPNWGGRVGWPAVGQRSDTVGGHRIVTVFYGTHSGGRIGYAIVSGSPVKVTGGTTITEGGVDYTLFNAGNARAITWRRNGHTCVIAGRSVNDHTLLTLASAEEAQHVSSWSRPAGASRIDTI